MKPITADNVEGRSLLALRAGPMTAGEISARVGSSLPGWLIKIGYVEQDDSYYRITAAGRAACPYRNPLAAPGVVQPYTLKSETEMPRENVITRQQVLAAIIEAGQTGTTRKHLIDHFECAEGTIDNHISLLAKQQPPVIFKPRPGAVCAIQFAAEQEQAIKGKATHATRDAVMAWFKQREAGCRHATPAGVAEAIGCTEDSTSAVLSGLYAGLKLDRVKTENDWAYFIGTPKLETQAEPVTTVNPKKEPKTESPAVIRAEPASPAVQALAAGNTQGESEIPAPMMHLLDLDLDDLEAIKDACETIEIKAVPDRRAPLAISINDADDFEASISSNGTMALIWEDDMDGGVIELSKPVLTKLRHFLGLFTEAL